MCISSIKSYTKSHYISVVHPTRFKSLFPCCMCADCIRRKRSEWSLRSYYEAKSVFKDKGFVLFDTLSYDDNHIKYFHDVYEPAKSNCWDFTCFNRDDVKKFFKRLRINLVRAGYDVDHRLRYLLTSEYGSDDVYIDERGRKRKATFRPHYHVLFFVYFNIDPVVFSRFVANSWINGRTDGVPYKNKWYVLQKRVIFSNRLENLKLINYVSKYISKDLYLYKRLYRRVFMCFSIRNPNWQESYSKRLEFRRFKNQVLPFHFQSLGFGKSALEFEDKEYYLNYDAFRMPSNKGFVVSIPMPQYYQRKLYYHLSEFQGKKFWCINNNALEYLKRKFDRSVFYLSQRLRQYCNALSIDNAKSIARYSLLWKGMLIPKEFIDFSDSELLSWLYDTNRYNYKELLLNGDVIVNHNNESDGYRNCKYLDNSFLVDHYNKVVRLSHKEFEVMPFANMIVVDQYSSTRFAGFDDFLDGYYYWLNKIGVINDKVMRDGEVQYQRYKMLGLVE